MMHEYFTQARNTYVPHPEFEMIKALRRRLVLGGPLLPY